MELNTKGLDFGTLLRNWRSQRRLSQADLANVVQTPSRHISFLETGRSKPSRYMISRLATALQVPFRERNALLQAAGFADLYPDRGLADDEVAMLRQALGHLMKAHDPFPSFLVDRYWNILDLNGGGQTIMKLVEEHFPVNDSAIPVNMMEAVFSPDGFRSHIINWEAYARQLIQRLHRESLTDQDLNGTIARIERHSKLPKEWWDFDVTYAAEPAFPINMRIDGNDLSFFTVVATVALPTDALAQEVRVETMFAADVRTDAYIRRRGRPS